ncbi:MAG TPA: UrcA family protein [Steroidobacteraceae bacterium]|nr:UrcA family protein [Steroidobacteraceae bacterium]
MNFVRPALLVCACALAPVWSYAADGVDGGVVSVKVSTGGLDLNTNEGAQALYRHLSVAATTACGFEYKTDALRGPLFERCYRETLGNAVRSINRPLVTQLYVEHYPAEAPRAATVAVAAK